MTTPNLPLAWEPSACTLPTIDRPLRLAEFDALFTGLTRLERIGRVRLRMHLTGESGLASTLRDLTARETECCSFFALTTTEVTDGQVTLDVEVPDDQTDVLDALARRAEAVAGTGAAA